MADTINISQDKWENVCSKIENEGIEYFLTKYVDVDIFKKKVLLMVMRKQLNYLRTPELL